MDRIQLGCDAGRCVCVDISEKQADSAHTHTHTHAYTQRIPQCCLKPRHLSTRVHVRNTSYTNYFIRIAAEVYTWINIAIPERLTFRVLMSTIVDLPHLSGAVSQKSKVAFYKFIQHIQVPNILNMVYTVRFFFPLQKCSLSHNSNILGSCIINIFIYRMC